MSNDLNIERRLARIEKKIDRLMQFLEMREEVAALMEGLPVATIESFAAMDTKFSDPTVSGVLIDKLLSLENFHSASILNLFMQEEVLRRFNLSGQSGCHSLKKTQLYRKILTGKMC